MSVIDDTDTNNRTANLQNNTELEWSSDWYAFWYSVMLLISSQRTFARDQWSWYIYNNHVLTR